MLSSIRIWTVRVLALALIVLVFAHGPITQPTVTVTSFRGTEAVWTHAPVVRPPARPRRPVVVPKNTILCLAQNLFFEAHNEPVEGLQAVAATVFNRMALQGYPSTVCGVVYQKYQYSWTLDTSNWGRTPPKEYMDMATEFLTEKLQLREMFPVTHFHRVDIHPRWADTLTYVATFGQHKFYGGVL